MFVVYFTWQTFSGFCLGMGSKSQARVLTLLLGSPCYFVGSLTSTPKTPRNFNFKDSEKTLQRSDVEMEESLKHLTGALSMATSAVTRWATGHVWVGLAHLAPLLEPGLLPTLLIEF